MAPIKEWFGLYNVIFNWFKEKYGDDALEEYWRFIADRCFGETAEKFRKEGLKGIKDYFEYTFGLDDGEYSSKLEGDCLTFEVTRCPDFEFMNSSDNPHFKPIPDYCKHHLVLNSILADKSGHTFMMKECSNNGKCKWQFKKKV